MGLVNVQMHECLYIVLQYFIDMKQTKIQTNNLYCSYCKKEFEQLVTIKKYKKHFLKFGTFKFIPPKTIKYTAM